MVTPSSSRGLAARLLPGFLTQEADLELVAVDAVELAAPIGKSGRGEQKEELGQRQTLNRCLDAKRCVALRYVLDQAGATPGAVDRHHLRRQRPLERNALALALFL